MPYTASIYKVMIASPSDVSIEKNIIKEVLSEWNAIHSASRSMALLPLSWETNSSPAMGEHPQSIINKQVLQGADILVGVFWTRIGTGTEKYLSGTVEEIEEHIKSGKPALLYFSSAPVMPDSIDVEQYANLVAFKKSCQARGLYTVYSDRNDFRIQLSRHIQLELNKSEYTSQGSPTPEILMPLSVSYPKLSKEAQDLLVQASGDTNGTIMRFGTMGGKIIQTNYRSFCNEGENPRNVAIWEGAITELESNDLIEPLSYKREMFRVTKAGYDIADLLRPSDI